MTHYDCFKISNGNISESLDVDKKWGVMVMEFIMVPQINKME